MYKETDTAFSHRSGKATARQQSFTGNICRVLGGHKHIFMG